MVVILVIVVCFKQKTAYEMRISDWSSDVCSSDLFAMEGAPAGGDSAEDRMYAKACQIVTESQKASTSWLQRQLRIGYNSAARLIERMEEEGLVSPPNHVGRRDVLTDQYEIGRASCRARVCQYV